MPVINTGIALDVVNELRGPNHGKAKEFFTNAVADFKFKVGALAILSALSINCDALPPIPEGLKIHHHISGGTVKWDKEEYSNPNLLYIVEKQRIGTVGGYELNARLAGKPVVNACILDWLMNHKDQIPESWRKIGAIVFWGTIYSDSEGSLCVRSLCWRGGRWLSDYGRLEYGWDDDGPALLATHFISKSRQRVCFLFLFSFIFYKKTYSLVKL